MHELGLVQALGDEVERQVASAGGPAAAVTRLVVRVGELAGVETDLLAAAWDAFRAGTRCATAALELRLEAAVWRCPRCASPGAHRRLRCVRCAGPLRLVAGGDLVLERIEMEMPACVEPAVATMAQPAR